MEKVVYTVLTIDIRHILWRKFWLLWHKLIVLWLLSELVAEPMAALMYLWRGPQS